MRDISDFVPDPSQASFNTPNMNATHTAPRPRLPLDVVTVDKAMGCFQSSEFCICAGTVTFRGRGDDKRVLVLLNRKYTVDLWQLPKGRKNIGEHDLRATAVRETYEETGYAVQLHSEDIETRATLANRGPEAGPVFIAQTPEPIAMVWESEPPPTPEAKTATKVIFYFAASVTDDALPAVGTQDEEEVLAAYWLTCDEAMRMLTFAAERKALGKAILTCS